MSNDPIFNIKTMKLEKYDKDNNEHIFPTYYMSRVHIEWTPTNPLYSGTSNLKNMNAGDLFTEFIINKLSNNYFYKFTLNGPEYIVTPPILGKERYLICGSLLQDSMPNSVLCGVGLIRSNPPLRKFKECYGVRGKLSLEWVKKCNPLYNYKNTCLGDPGLTLSYFYENYEIKKKYKYGIILHMCDVELIFDYFDVEFLKECCIIDIRTSDFEKLSKDICSCNVIISSSLHGIIFAHSYSIPTIWIELNKSILCGEGSDYIKYFDYFSIFNDNLNYNLKNRRNNNISNWIDYMITDKNISKLKIYTPKRSVLKYTIKNILNMVRSIIIQFKPSLKLYIYIPINKCANTTYTKIFSEYDCIERFNISLNYEKKLQLLKDKYKYNFKFAIIRHPIKRFISAAKMFVRDNKMKLENVVDNIINIIKNTKEELLTVNYITRHTLPLSHELYCIVDKDNTINLDLIIYLEQINTNKYDNFVYNNLLKTNIHLNTTNEIDIEIKLNSEQLDFLYKYYEKDFYIFNYQI